MKKIIIAVFLGISVLNFAQTSNKKVSELLEVMGTKNMMSNVLSNMIEQYETTYPEVPKEFWQKCKSEKNIDALVEKMTPLYSKYYSDKEINDLIVFYKSPTGKKMIETMPQIMQESMQIGQDWGMNLAKEITKELEEKYHYKSPPPTMPAKSK